MNNQTKMSRYWINQPSGLQPLHNYHGANVIAPENTAELMVTVYLVNGPVISMLIPRLCLSKGWLFKK